MGDFYMGVLLFLGGALAVVFNKRETRNAADFYYKYTYKLVGKELNEKAGRIGYIVCGTLFMVVGLLMMVNAYFSK